MGNTYLDRVYYKLDMSITYDPSLILSGIPCPDTGQRNYSNEVLLSAWAYLNGEGLRKGELQGATWWGHEKEVEEGDE